MLKSISIQNYALIDKVQINFYPGFSVITGETGAGKSILLGALGLILGNRADLKTIKDTGRKCIVEGEFSIRHLDLKDFFIAKDLDYDELTILRREITSAGKSRAFVNDSPVSLHILKELAEKFVNIHSQHQTLHLSKLDFQLEALDAFTNNISLLEDYQKEFKIYKDLLKQTEELKRTNTQLKKDEDYLKFQLNELNSVKLEENIIDQLKERESFLSNAGEIAVGINICKELLDENEISVNHLINEVRHTIKKMSDYHSNLNKLADRIESVEIELKDISAEIHRLSNEMEFDPQELQEIESKLDAYYSLQQKHQLESIAELIELKKNIATKLESIETFDDELKAKELSLTNHFSKVAELGEELHKERTQKARNMEEEMKSLLKELGMNNAEFVIEIKKQAEYTMTGSDRVSFLFSANKGGKPRQLSMVASGGELSRLMLAIKSLINQRNVLPTVIFDEIDAGVSGEIAGKVGNIMKGMSEKHQVLAITHLPQIASKAQYHYNVYKEEHAESTSTEIELLDDSGRVEAIAKMLSDEIITESSVKAAQELLK
jgi:DNA repair protein RecN (Recombination protein N)